MWTDAVEALAEVVAGYFEAMNPSVVVIGRRLAQAGDLLLGPLAAAIRGRVAYARSVPDVRPARFGDRAALVGAAVAAHELAAGTGHFSVPFQGPVRLEEARP